MQIVSNIVFLKFTEINNNFLWVFYEKISS